MLRGRATQILRTAASVASRATVRLVLRVSGVARVSITSNFSPYVLRLAIFPIYFPNPLVQSKKRFLWLLDRLLLLTRDDWKRPHSNSQYLFAQCSTRSFAKCDSSGPMQMAEPKPCDAGREGRDKI